MIGVYNYTVILTYLGLFSGFSGILYIIDGNLKMSLILLMVSGFCDMFDGKIASTKVRTKNEKRFGIQIDSLSDLVCFGVLPAVTVFRCSGGNAVHGIIPAIYLLCALIRLAWFNVDEETRQNQESGSREKYLGLPVTSAALLLPLCIGTTSLLSLPYDQITMWTMLIIALAFVTPFHLRKPGNLGKLIMVLLGAVTFALVMIGVKA